MDRLITLTQTDGCSLFEISSDARALASSDIRRLIVSTPESRAICNDPFVLGVDYTERLQAACCKALTILGDPTNFGLSERTAAVFHILRGGLNFGLREALANAYGWNTHASVFISAQRERVNGSSEEWCISECSYQKLSLPNPCSIVFGDVVATGTSLEFGLHQVLRALEQAQGSVTSFLFFTIGGPRSEQLLREIDKTCRTRFPNYVGSTVVYLEGRFAVASTESRLRIKLTGTDLLRTDSLLSPEFLESQYSDPAYPLERCTIYDAGSRAFSHAEYLGDVTEYWEQVLSLSNAGIGFQELLHERFPELEAARFGPQDLGQIARRQIERAHSLR